MPCRGSGVDQNHSTTARWSVFVKPVMAKLYKVAIGKIVKKSVNNSTKHSLLASDRHETQFVTD